MKLSKTQKIWLGIGTFLPAICGLLFAIAMLGFVSFAVPLANAGAGSNEAANGLIGAISIPGFGLFLFSIFVMSGISLAVLIIYIIHAVKNPKFESTDRLLWILLFVFIGFIGEVIYFFMYIVKSNSNKNENLDSENQGRVAPAG